MDEVFFTALTDWFEDRRKFGGLLLGPFVEQTLLKPISFHIDNGRKLSKTQKDNGLWARCNNCENTLHVKFSKQNMSIRDACGYHFPMNSAERIEFLIDRKTWIPMDEDMTSMDALGFFDQDSYLNRIRKSQEETGLTDAVQTGLGRLHGITIALGVMDFRFMGGSMGSVVGEKITRLIEYAARESLPLVIVCASGGARMQEGTLSLMQMAKISSALQNYHIQNRWPYITILTHPTTGGVTASFAMLGDIIIAEPAAYIAFAGKRVIEQTLNQRVPDGLQSAETVFKNGLLDLIVPRNLPKGVLSEIFEPYYFAPYSDGDRDFCCVEE